MTTTPTRAAPQRISGPGELLQAVPYLLGFHPQASLVLVGLHHGELVVTARLDLEDAARTSVLAQTVQAMCRGGTSEIVAAVYDDPVEGPVGRGRLPHILLVDRLADAAATAECRLLEVLFVSGGLWWSYSCDDPGCCPPAGRSVPAQPSAFTAAATYAGVVALPDRESLAAQLEPRPGAERDHLDPLIAAAEHEEVSAVLAGRASRHQRSVKRSIFAAARACTEPGWCGPPDPEIARFAAALGEIAMRDAVWMAIDDGRLDGRPLWRDLAGRVPDPYGAPALFLFGWASWRAGDGALAGIAAERAICSNPDYSAADLLLAAIARGLDPRTLPRLRLPRPA